MDRVVKIELLGQEYLLRTETEEAKVQAAADLVRDKLEEYREAARSNIKLNVAILAALDLANEYLQLKETHDQLVEGLEIRSRNILEAIEAEVEK